MMTEELAPQPPTYMAEEQGEGRVATTSSSRRRWYWGGCSGGGGITSTRREPRGRLLAATNIPLGGLGLPTDTGGKGGLLCPGMWGGREIQIR
uniref:Uncharacterized protein n=1 Tax=Oryza punctata TaxID=4537 RepID=A0A0E0KZG6_ORYPU